VGVFKRKIKSNNKTTEYWYMRYHLNGKDKWESVGEVGIVTKTVAQRVFEERKRQIALGQYDQIGVNVPTIIEFKDEYISYKRDIRQNRAWKRDVNSLKHLCYYFGNKKLSSITPNDIIEYQNIRLRDTINNHHIKPATINRELSCLRSLFNLAKQKNKFFSENPVSKVSFLEENNLIERILSYKEEEKAFRYLPTLYKTNYLYSSLYRNEKNGDTFS